jgi:hypothetical protein
MNREREHFRRMGKGSLLGAGLALLIAIGGADRVQGQASPLTANGEKRTMTRQSKFYCNTKALDPTERAHHKQLTEKLVAARKDIVETEKGYEFQFTPAKVSLSELADWVAAEGKCCPFFDFHIDLEHEGSLLCLRLTGEEGIKEFIRAEFQMPAK